MVIPLLLDCYQDEPACLGVPPYLSPRVRYAAGAASLAGTKLRYTTVDELRKNAGPVLRGKEVSGSSMDRAREWMSGIVGGEAMLAGDIHILVFAGVVIPGKYLRAVPASYRELANIPRAFREMLGASGDRTNIDLCGPVARFRLVSHQGDRWGGVYGKEYDTVVEGTPASALLRALGEDGGHRCDVTEEADMYWETGAGIVKQHPDFPDPIICEIETYQGCVRYASGGCGFCSQSNYGRPRFREPESIVREMRALADQGVRRFRLGGQSCFYSYGTEELGESERPRPNPSAVTGLLEGIRSQVENIEVLHIDNVNPAILAEHPAEAEEITRAVVKYCTPGNVAAMGLESADPAVAEANNLNSTSAEAMEAIRMVNRHGRGIGSNGMPHFLPGINFLGGLKGETAETYEMNMTFLRELVKEDLMVRRINIRGVTAHGYGRPSGKKQAAFRRFRRIVRDEIDPWMLERVIPSGSVLERVYLERRDGKITFGRQVGAYPVLVGFPYELPLETYVDAAVVSHSSRSVTAVVSPFPVNRCTLRALASLPGIGKKRAGRIAVGRPVLDEKHLGEILEDEELARGLVDITGGMVFSDRTAE